LEIKINVYPAKNGDCFLISFGKTDSKQNHLLIDCGYTHTVTNYLKGDLLKISRVGECLERLILTHVDADHIQGAIKLLKDNNSEKFIEIKEIWHNTFRHLFEKGLQGISKKQESILKRIVQRGYPTDESKQGEQVISAEQGTTVGARILQGDYLWNNDFYNKSVCVENRREIPINHESHIYLLSPDSQKLNELKKYWKNELKRYGVNYNHEASQLYDDAFEMLAAWEKEVIPKQSQKISSNTELLDELLKRPFGEDKTATNGSSIAFVLMVENKRLLFLADAHPDLIVKSLKEYQTTEKIYFDMIKVSHHGSFRNISQELMDKIDSNKYIFSTNGKKHSHPDKETIAHIINRKVDFHRVLYFNYVTDNSEYFNRTDWMKKYNYSIHYLDKTSYTIEL